jgi:hypothetical protein
MAGVKQVRLPDGYPFVGQGHAAIFSADTELASENPKKANFIYRIFANRPSGKFALMEFSEIRVRQDSYSRLYEP